MNEEHAHLTTQGDEATEARIIAWVLGEASAFEAAELEALCEQMPEWRVFHRRMLALHDCLKEAHAPAVEGEWALPAEKRGKLDELLGHRETVAAVRSKSRRVWWVNVAGIAALLMLLVVVGSLATGVFGKAGKMADARMMKESQEIVSYSAEAPRMAQFKEANDGSFPVTPATPVDADGDGFEPPELPVHVGVAANAAANSDSSVAAASERDGDVDPFAAREENSSQALAMRSRPSAPSSATTSAAAVPSALAIPVPTVEGNDPSVVFSDGDALGEGWGGQELAGGGGYKKQESVTDGKNANGVPLIRDIPGVGQLGNEQAGAEGRVPKIDPSAESVTFNGRNFNVSPTTSGERSKKEADSLQSHGKFSDAQQAYEQVLRENPYDKEARRGLEELAKAKTDYYRSAYDHTRAELLMEVDKAWELEIPEDAKGQKGEAVIAGKEMFQKAGVKDAVDAVAKVSEQSTVAGGVAEPTGEKTKEWEKTMAPKPGATAAPAQEPAPVIARVVKKPKPLPLPVAQEITTADEPYSTFSLRVSDNAFRIAQAAMAQNQRPAADSVRVEEFYNAFDYGDPIPTAQEPVTASMEQSAHPILPQRNLLRIALRTASVGRSAGQPLRLTLLIDQSGSMNRGDRRAALLASVQELSQMLQEQDQVSVIGFSRTPRLLAEKIPGNQTQRLLEIVRAVPSDGGTNLEEALKLGEVVAKRNQLPNAQNRLLLLTDGAANLGNADPGRLSEWVKQLRQKNLSFDIAGIGTDGLNDPLLVEIARHGNGRYYVMNDAAQAKQQFAQQLAGAFRPVAENVKVQVQFNPQRVSRYQLIGFEKDRLRTEDFRNDKVDAAEMAAAEAGQALYQIELLPEGTGEIGEVSVRFRDVATQQMVERKWTIRHDATTPVFDRATPTMQLAGLAMLSAQKLQGGDFAPMIRFSEMQEPRRRVRESFSQSQRVGELLQMIDQLQD